MDVIDVPLHWLGIVVCMLAIGLASAAEAALSSISRRQLNALHHSSRATLVYDLINDAYRFKVSLLLLNTMAVIGLTALTVGLVQSLPLWYQFSWLLALTLGVILDTFIVRPVLVPAFLAWLYKVMPERTPQGSTVVEETAAPSPSPAPPSKVRDATPPPPAGRARSPTPRRRSTRAEGFSPGREPRRRGR